MRKQSLRGVAYGIVFASTLHCGFVCVCACVCALVFSIAQLFTFNHSTAYDV